MRVPGWVFARATWTTLAGFDLRFPVIVKPNFEGSSMGITADSVVEDPRAARGARWCEALARSRDGIMVEEYIAGRDVVVPFLEAAAPETARHPRAGRIRLSAPAASATPSSSST